MLLLSAPSPGMRLKIYQHLQTWHTSPCQWNYEQREDLSKNGTKKLYTSSCQARRHSPLMAFDESVLKSIDARQPRLRLFEVRIDFLFNSVSITFSGEASVCEWKDAAMDIQYIWLGHTVGVLGGVTNVATVCYITGALPSPPQPAFLLPLRIETGGIAHCARAATPWKFKLFRRVLAPCARERPPTRSHSHIFR